MPLIAVSAVAALLVSGGFFIDKAGEGVNDASNAAIKIAIAGGIGFIVAKKLKVI